MIWSVNNQQPLRTPRLSVLFGGKKATSLPPEIQQKVDAFRQGLTDLVAWDKQTHPDRPVINEINIPKLVKNAQGFLKRQADAGMKLIPFLIGMAGGSASGKSFAKKHLMTLIANEATELKGWQPSQGPVVDHLELDMFYKEDFDRRKTLGETRFFQETNLDEPDALTLDQAQETIHHLKRGTAMHSPFYNFLNAKRTEKAHAKNPTPFFIVEGLFALLGKGFGKSAKTAMHKQYDMNIYVDADRDVIIDRWWQRAPERNVQRDEAGMALFNRTFSMHDVHVAPTKDNAHIVLDSTSGKDATLNTLKRLSQLLVNTFYPFQREEQQIA